MEQAQKIVQDGDQITPRPFRRRVFYIPGYDPNPARRYRELYRKEGAAQAAISGYRLRMAGRHHGGGPGWSVETEIGGRTTRAEIEVLVWSDLVQGSMRQGIVATYAQLCRTAWIYLRSGALWRLARLRQGPVIAALYPVLFLLAQLALAVLAGIGLARLGSALGLAAPPGWAGGAALAWAVLVVFRRQDGRFFAHYLMHDYAFTARHRGAPPPELAARLAGFRDRIRAALEAGGDEVLVVGHSSGAHLAVTILADLLRDRTHRSGPDRPALGLLTLGQVVPMLAFLPEARDLRRDLFQLSQSDALCWVDISAPGDGCAFALCDPVSTAGLGSPQKRWPLVISAAFSQTLSVARLRALRWRYFRLHFQYLCAYDRPGDHDYFALTAGPVSLAARFAGRAPSRSRIETPLSGYRDMAQ
jgi:hypothetical protein